MWPFFYNSFEICRNSFPPHPPVGHPISQYLNISVSHLFGYLPQPTLPPLIASVGILGQTMLRYSSYKKIDRECPREGSPPSAAGNLFKRVRFTIEMRAFEIAKQIRPCGPGPCGAGGQDIVYKNRPCGARGLFIMYIHVL